MPEIFPYLWFDTESEEAADFYVGIFPNSRILDVTHYTKVGPRPEGMVLTVVFELDGKKFGALNGGPEFKFNEAVSFTIECRDQAEIDYYWEKLQQGGGQPSECGWLKDKFGVSWQVNPIVLNRMIADPDREKADRVMAAMMKMKKLEIAPLEAAYRGES
jgi:predicted 3-demethylubiquinone-9 3-methyltransferase (glyoxalase superfamily)